MRAIVFGGYGTFGILVARGLAKRGIAVTIAGRDRAKAEAAARSLGGAAASEHRGVAADAKDGSACRVVLPGHAAAANCAGPFASLGTALLEACLDAGCHYADIADERAYIAAVRALGERFAARGLAAVYGCSSLPGISGALAIVSREGNPAPPERARVTLMIGNDNPKGGAAVRTALAGVGRPFRAPQGELRGFRGREVVDLPPPFGRRAVYDFEAPEYDLFPALLGVREVRVKVGFELRSSTALFATLAALSSRWGERTARLLERIGGLGRGIGRSGGAVMSELFWADGRCGAAALSGERDAQPMAALPCTLVIAALCDGSAQRHGALAPYELLGARALLETIATEGYELTVRAPS